MDYSTLPGVTSLATATAAISVIAFSMLYWENIALRIWALAEVLWAIGGICFALFPPTMTSIGHTMLFGFYVLALKGILTFFKGFNHSLRLPVASIILYGLFIQLMTLAGWIEQRIIFTQSLLLLISIYTGFVVFRLSWRDGCYVGRALGVYFFLQSSAFAYRLITVLFYPELNAASLGGLYLESVASSIVFPTSFILLVSEKMLRDREQEARVDPLTQVLNRRAFPIAAKPLLNRCLRYKKPVCALVFDLDHFKKINDTLGHATGDKVLQLCASYIEQSIRDQDVFARIGGEEFVLLLPDTPLRGGSVLAERLRQGFQAEALAKMSLQSTFSAGIYCHEGGEISLDELLDRADQLLLEAKKSGRNRVYCGTEESLPDLAVSQ